jgi:hypothetical protein
MQTAARFYEAKVGWALRSIRIGQIFAVAVVEQIDGEIVAVLLAVVFRGLLRNTDPAHLEIVDSRKSDFAVNYLSN